MENQELTEGLKAIANYPDETQLFGFCETYGVKFHPMEPPYLTQAKIAQNLLGKIG